jgi:hypothetical protein
LNGQEKNGRAVPSSSDSATPMLLTSPRTQPKQTFVVRTAEFSRSIEAVRNVRICGKCHVQMRLRVLCRRPPAVAFLLRKHGSRFLVNFHRCRFFPRATAGVGDVRVAPNAVEE